ncbi:hypothetical protein A2U01_0070395, partial [Trifolium medium]|nr:hypothetical protein [Trifolium medium]
MRSTYPQGFVVALLNPVQVGAHVRRQVGLVELQ